jgi:DMSO/TMAO reductase YedYZ heme-binding membrane subunit
VALADLAAVQVKGLHHLALYHLLAKVILAVGVVAMLVAVVAVQAGLARRVLAITAEMVALRHLTQYLEHQLIMLAAAAVQVILAALTD